MMMMNPESMYDYSDGSQSGDDEDATAITIDDPAPPGAMRPNQYSNVKTMNANKALRRPPRSPQVSTTSSSASSSASHNHTIALFGGSGRLGQEFLHVALDAGYCVRMLADHGTMPGGEEKRAASANLLQIIVGELDDPKCIRSVLHHADFVVCLLNDTLPIKNYPAKYLSSFVKFLYPFMNDEPSIQLFLFQSISLASDLRGNTPMLSKLVKRMAPATGRTAQFQDHDACVRVIAQQHHGIASSASMGSQSSPHFSFLVIRPTMFIKERSTTGKLCASKSQPGPLPISYTDLAEFTLGALLNTKLYNSCPYVVTTSGT